MRCEDSDRVNLTIRSEAASQVVFGNVIWEVLDKQIAPLLRSEKLKALMGELSLALALLESGPHIESLAVDEPLVHCLDSFGSTLGAILTVLGVVCIAVADESKHTGLCLIHARRRDVAESLEMSKKVRFCPVVWHILDENVVEHLSHV